MTKIVRKPNKATGGITEVERAAMVDHAALWTARAFRTEPINHQKITEAIEALYVAAKLKKPRVVVASSPLVMALAYGAACTIWFNRAVYGTANDTMDNFRATDTATFDAGDYVVRCQTFGATYTGVHNTSHEATSRATLNAVSDVFSTEVVHNTVAVLNTTGAATYDASDSETRGASITATNNVIGDITLDATSHAVYAAIDNATDLATQAVENAAYAATDAATDIDTQASAALATRALADTATYSTTRKATYDATQNATDIATRAAVYNATFNNVTFNDPRLAGVPVSTAEATRRGVDAVTQAAADATQNAASGKTTTNRLRPNIDSRVAVYNATRVAAVVATNNASDVATTNATYRTTRNAVYNAVDDITRNATHEATAAATAAVVRNTTRNAHAAVDDANANLVYQNTYNVTRDATIAIRRATVAAINDATAAAVDDAPVNTTFKNTNPAYTATRNIAYNVVDDTRDAIDGATTAATADATAAVARNTIYATTYQATKNATAFAVDDATDLAIDYRTYVDTRDASRKATFDATYQATRHASYAAIDAVTDVPTRTSTSVVTYNSLLDLVHGAASVIREATNAATTTNPDAEEDAVSGAIRACYELGGNDALTTASHWSNVYQGGNMWAPYDCYLTAMRDIIGLRLPPHEQYKAWETAAIEGGFRVLHEKFCIVSDFPEFIKADDQSRPHCADGPSHRWRDGWSLYHWHGVAIPSHWIERRDELTAAEVLKETNLEKRRVGCEIIGWSKILAELGSKTVDRDDDPEIGELLEVKLPDLDRPARFLRVRCGTGREFMIGIPPNIKTALNAQAWLVGLDGKDFKMPEVRT